MNDLEDPGPHDLVPYKRGLPFGDVLKGSLTKFLPGSIAGLLGVLAYGGWPADFIANVPGYLGFVAVVTGGFALGLEALRRWLYPDAKVGGSRSFVAGLMAGALWFSTLTLIPGLRGPEAWFVFPFLGVVLAVLMFFAWLTPTPEEMKKEAGPAADGRTARELPRGDL